MEFKELTIEELTRGYVKSEKTGVYTCIFCGETFEEGIIYNCGGRNVTAERAAEEHMFSAHGGAFHGLMGLDKQISGISDTQKEILEGMYLEKDNRMLSDEMGISTATVRTHKFNIQRMKREAKILLAMLEQIENEDIAEKRKMLELHQNVMKPEDFKLEREFTGNSLHPFFSQLNLK
ncbi:MAG: LuxR C-terminal-related transcriptional regulator [Anaerovoracaceae bacterium]